jgi:hypothetical protein
LRNSQRLKSDIFIKASPGQPASQIHSQVLEGRNLERYFGQTTGFGLAVPILVVVFHVLNTTIFVLTRNCCFPGYLARFIALSGSDSLTESRIRTGFQ